MSNHHHTTPIDPRIVSAANEGCEESRLLISRRELLGLSAGFFASAMIPRSALSAVTDKRLLVVILRGGMDGLHVAIPHKDQTYLDYRSSFLASVTNSATTGVKLARYSEYILNPRLGKFGALFNAGNAAIVQAIAPPLRNRSHFQCQFNLESGQDANNLQSTDGWLNRLLQNLPSAEQVTVKGALGVGPAPLILAGRAPVRSWSMDGHRSGFPDAALSALETYYAQNDPTPGALLQEGRATNDRVWLSADAPGLTQVNTKDIRNNFRGAAKLMSAEDGPRIGVLSIDGWDSHTTEIAADHTGIGYRLGMLDDGIDDFRIQMGALWSKTAIVCVTEFGRTIQINNSTDQAGTEHGIGSIALLAGGSLRGNRFYGHKPDLKNITSNTKTDPITGNRNDIPATTDTRQLFKSVLIDHLGVDSKIVEEKVFPNSAAAPKIPNMF